MQLMIDSPPTIEWNHDRIKIIDQTLLPSTLKVVELCSVAAVVDAISRLAVRGAPAIGAVWCLRNGAGARTKGPPMVVSNPWTPPGRFWPRPRIELVAPGQLR